MSNKLTRGNLPLIALQQPLAKDAVAAIQARDASAYRPFSMIIADRSAALFLFALGYGRAEAVEFESGIHMLTTATPNDIAVTRIARHPPRFRAAPFPKPPHWRS